MTEHTATIIPFDPQADAESTASRIYLPNKEASDLYLQTGLALLELAGTDDPVSGPVTEKLQDALTPGYQAEFDPAEAEAAGAFQEDALSEADAIASTHDTLHFKALAAPAKG